MTKAIVLLTCALGVACGVAPPEPHAPPVVREKQILAAITRHDAAEVKRLLDAGADPDGDTRSLLNHAADVGDEASVAALLDAGADPNEARFRPRHPYSGDVALFNAIARGYAGIVRRLINAGADPNLRTWRETPLCAAVDFGRVEIATKLIEAKADPNARCPYGGPGSARAQVQADSSRPDHGWTPLMIAARLGHEPFVQLFLAAGADPNLTDEQGRTALDWALTRERPAAAVVQALREATRRRR